MAAAISPNSFIDDLCRFLSGFGMIGESLVIPEYLAAQFCFLIDERQGYV